MPTIFSTSPHFDDYNETKQFVRILFRPGRAVQARELTQLQTIIQGQIERFGKGVYKEGTFVTPPETAFDNSYSYVKLTESTGATVTDDAISGLVGTEIVSTTGVKALIVNHSVSTTAGDPPTIFVKYTNGGVNNALKFSDGDTLTSGSTTLTSIASDSCGNGSAFSVGQTVVFAKGNFLYVDEQTHVIEKYTSPGSKLVGFNITESVITSDDDDSLLDPATGTFNFFAPGADRYKAELTLSSKALEFTSNTDPNFVEIARIENNVITSLSNNPQFSVLGDALARRTFDESGNYVVNPFQIEVFEHLRTSSTANNISESSSVRDGIFTSASGGSNNLFVAKVTSGKAYVRGYEVDNLKTSYLTLSKARDNTDTISSVIPTSLSSFVKVTDADSIPDFSSIVTLSLKDQFKSGNIATNGNEIGTAKARGLIYLTGNVAAGKGGTPNLPSEDRTAEFQLHVFDINMNPGEDFERDVKQITSTNSYTNFSSNIIPVAKILSGGLTFNNASTTVRGSGTRFQTEFKSGDTFNVSNSTVTDKLVVSSITDDVTLTLSSVPTINLQQAVEVTYATYTRDEALINNPDNDSLIFKLPNEDVKNVDDSVITYSVKRQFTGITLSSGATTLGPLSSGENFAPFSTDNYVAVITSGGRAGHLIRIQSSQVTRDTVNRTIEFDFSGAAAEGLASETVTIYATVTKGTGAAARLKTKTLVSDSTITITDQESAQASIISLKKADGFKLKSVKMANVSNPFGGSYNEDAHSNITSRYTFDNGQKTSFYDVSKIKLIPGQAKPTHPIKITFDHFTHSNDGDYFDVSSYATIPYEDIPTVTLGDNKFKLRDCIDFRPRINDAGTGFTGTGTPTNQPLFLDPEVDFTVNFRHYLPKISSIGIDDNGSLLMYEGVSSLDPKEPDFPADLVKLFVLEQNAYVYNIIDDIKVKVVPNKRFTMKDIGKIENRVRTLEYYTTLNLLERDAEQTQIQDSLGFDRFKNGFLVDSFTGHGVGDSIENPDYATSVNYEKRTAGPLVRNEMIQLVELNYGSSDNRTSNNYQMSREVITLPFTEEVLLQNPFSSKTNNLNPFNIAMFQGLMHLSPPGQIFFDDRKLPEQQVDQVGNYDSLSNQSLVKKDGKNVFGSISDIEQFNQGTVIETDKLPNSLKSLGDVIGALSPTTTTVEVTGTEVVKNTSIIPKMRTVGIRFSVDGLRPNTNFHAFFDDLNVSSFVTLDTSAVVEARKTVDSTRNTTNLTTLASAQVDNISTLKSDDSGSMTGSFFYSSDSLNLDVGKKIFRITNSSINDKSSEISFAEATFFSDGIVREIFNEVLRPRQDSGGGGGDGGGYNPNINSFQRDQLGRSPVNTIEDPGTEDDDPVTVVIQDYTTIIYNAIASRNPEAGASDYWTDEHPVLNKNIPYTDLNLQEKIELAAATAAISSAFLTNALDGKEVVGEFEPQTLGGSGYNAGIDTRNITPLSSSAWVVKGSAGGLGGTPKDIAFSNEAAGLQVVAENALKAAKPS